MFRVRVSWVVAKEAVYFCILLATGTASLTATLTPQPLQEHCPLAQVQDEGPLQVQEEPQLQAMVVASSSGKCCLVG